jgi:cytochrome b561
MKIKNTAEKFGLLAKVFHWIIAISIIGLIWLGWYMVDLSYYDKWYNRSLDWHKSLGMLVLGAAILKIGWQLYSPTPKTLKKLENWERLSANTVHIILIAMMILIPVTGYLISTSNGMPVDVFGWFDIPAPVSKNKGLRDLAIELHYYLAYATAVLVLGHIGAALKHQFIDKDGTLLRMLWR